jgi:hypothetical protein
VERVERRQALERGGVLGRGPFSALGRHNARHDLQLVVLFVRFLLF